MIVFIDVSLFFNNIATFCRVYLALQMTAIRENGLNHREIDGKFF